LNLGLEFSILKNRINGTFEIYKKSGIDLIGRSPIAPQTGVSQFTGNVANTETNGFDFELTSINLNGRLKWRTNVIINRAKDKITKYLVAVGNNQAVVSSTLGNLSPLEGYPIYSIFSFPSAGLDNTGSPQGYVDGAVSKSYATIRNSVKTDQLAFSGSGTPNTFGSLINTFSFRNFEVSFNILYKFGYYFRRRSLDNSSLYSRSIVFTQPDYEKRWQNPGDESLTSVPALIYPANTARTSFYAGSEVLIEPGDHVRLQDIQLSYKFLKTHHKFLPIREVMLYGYITNTNVVWSKSEIIKDPEARSGFPSPTTYSLGLRANF
jgi:hypothetical protein